MNNHHNFNFYHLCKFYFSNTKDFGWFMFLILKKSSFNELITILSKIWKTDYSVDLCSFGIVLLVNFVVWRNFLPTLFFLSVCKWTLVNLTHICGFWGKHPNHWRQDQGSHGNARNFSFYSWNFPTILQTLQRRLSYIICLELECLVECCCKVYRFPCPETVAFHGRNAFQN